MPSCRQQVGVPIWALIILLVFVIRNTSYPVLPDIPQVLGDGLHKSQQEGFLNDETNVPIPTDKHGKQLTLEERIRYLELKTNSFTHFGSDPFFAVNDNPSLCNASSNLEEFGCQPGLEGYYKGDNNANCPGLFDHRICLDELPKPKKSSDKKEKKKNDDKSPCLVYDFGIRAQPQFGAVMARTFGCEVHGFDPSPVSTEWWKSDESKALRRLPNYHFHPYGAGGVDGVVTLKEYNWGQVSILRYPSIIVNCTGKTGPDCNLEYHNSMTFQLPVKTLPTIIKELGHEGQTIDILKIDVEGSEYAFLENLLDKTSGCPDFIKQISLEWHHFSWDSKYGEGASPSINAIATLLHTCGLKNFWQHSIQGWPAGDKIYQDLGMKDVRYNLVSFMKDRS